MASKHIVSNCAKYQSYQNQEQCPKAEQCNGQSVDVVDNTSVGSLRARVAGRPLRVQAAGM